MIDGQDAEPARDSLADGLRSYAALMAGEGRRPPTPIEEFARIRMALHACSLIPECCPADTLGVRFMSRAVFHGDCAIARGSARPSAVARGFAHLHEWWYASAPDLYRIAGLATTDEGTDEGMLATFRSMRAWIHDVFMPVARGASVREPGRDWCLRQLWKGAAIGAVEAGVFDDVASRRAVFAALKELRLGVELSDLSTEVLSLNATCDFDVSQLTRAPDGRVRLGRRQVRDRLGARQVPVQKSQASADDAHDLSARAESRLPLPPEVAQLRESQAQMRKVELVRVVQAHRRIEVIRRVKRQLDAAANVRSYRARVAALEYLGRAMLNGGGGSRKETAAKHGVSVEQLRYAEKAVEPLLREALSKSA